MKPHGGLNPQSCELPVQLQGVNLVHARHLAQDVGGSLWLESAPELDRLLATRAAGFTTNLVVALGLALAVTAAVFLLACLLVRSVMRALAGLDARIRQLADLGPDAPVPEAGGATKSRHSRVPSSTSAIGPSKRSPRLRATSAGAR